MDVRPWNDQCDLRCSQVLFFYYLPAMCLAESRDLRQRLMQLSRRR